MDPPKWLKNTLSVLEEGIHPVSPPVPHPSSVAGLHGLLKLLPLGPQLRRQLSCRLERKDVTSPADSADYLSSQDLY